MTGRQPIKPALEQLANSRQGVHYDEEILVDYADGILEEPEKNEVRDHLTYCKPCAQTVLQLLEPLNLDSIQEADGDSSKKKPVFWGARSGFGLAACFFLALLLTLFYKSPNTHPPIRSDVIILDIFPMDTPRDRGSTDRPIAQIQGSKTALLLLNTLNTTSGDVWLIRFYLGNQSSPVHERVANPATPLPVLVSPGLTPGDYKITVSGRSQTGETELDSYQLKVVP